MPWKELAERINDLLEEIQSSMLARARAELNQRTVVVNKWEDFVPTLEKKCMCLVPWCDDEDMEVRTLYKQRRSKR